MATQDVLPSYLDNLLMFYTNLGGGGAAGPQGLRSPTPDNPVELFTGIGNWADFCVAPRNTVIRHPNEPIDNYPGEYDDEQEGYNPYNPHTAEDYAQDNRPDNLPMPDLTVESFFDAANMLTGSYLGRIGEAWTLLRDEHNNFMQGTMSLDPASGHGPNSFFSTIDHILDDWQGTAAQAAHAYAADVRDAFEAQARMVGWLGESLAAYTGIVLGARRQMLDLMRAFRETMRAKERSDGAAAQEQRNFVIGVFATVATTLLSTGGSLVAAAAAAGSAEVGRIVTVPFLNLGVTLTDKVLEKGDGSLDGDDYAAIAVSYLRKAGDVVANMKTAIDQLVDGTLENSPMPNLTKESNWPRIPAPLVTRKQFDEDPAAIDDLEPRP